MSYHDLSSCALDDDERRAEADRLTVIIGEFEDKLTDNERKFVQSRETDSQFP